MGRPEPPVHDGTRHPVSRGPHRAIPAAIARSKGESLAAWWLFGTVLFIVALPAAILLEPRPEGWRDPASPRALRERRRELRDDLLGKK